MRKINKARRHPESMLSRRPCALSGLMTFSWAMTAIGNASFLGDFPPASAPPPKPASRNFLIQDSVEGLLAKTSPTHPCPEQTFANLIIQRQVAECSRPSGSPTTECSSANLNGRWVPSGSTSAMCRYADRGGFWPLSEFNNLSRQLITLLRTQNRRCSPATVCL
jgi:hypothetical protein